MNLNKNTNTSEKKLKVFLPQIISPCIVTLLISLIIGYRKYSSKTHIFHRDIRDMGNHRNSRHWRPIETACGGIVL